jgi:hypothetical protein
MYRGTLVSSFMSGVNNCAHKTDELYYEFARPLLLSPAPKIIFLDEPMFNTVVEKSEYNDANTKIMLFPKSQMVWYDKRDTLNYGAISDQTTKDTIEFFITMCNKTSWIKMAIEMNTFETEQFVWVDFGISNILKGMSLEEMTEHITKLATKEYDLVRMGNIHDLNTPFYWDISTRVCWYFAGGVFGGQFEMLLFFNDLVVKECNRLMESENRLLWEVNIWYFVYQKAPHLFDCYRCDHNLSLISEY